MSSRWKNPASRANGARSKGPVTPEGKRRSSQNAVKHGLRSQHALLRDESDEGFQESLQMHVECLPPTDPMEFQLLQDMTSTQWCQGRALAMEKHMLETEAALQPGADPLDRLAGAFASLAGRQSFHLLNRYQNRLSRQYQTQLHGLLILRNLKRPNEPTFPEIVEQQGPVNEQPPQSK